MHDCQDLRRLQNDTQVELDTSQDKRIVYYMIFRTLSSWQNCMARLHIKTQRSYSITAVKLQMIFTQTALASSCQDHVNQREVQISVTLLN